MENVLGEFDFHLHVATAHHQSRMVSHVVHEQVPSTPPTYRIDVALSACVLVGFDIFRNGKKIHVILRHVVVDFFRDV